MSLFIQHGHGKGNKITEALSAGSADGVVFSARNEKPENLDSCIAEMRETGDCEILFDPQFYVSTLLPPNDRYLPEYYPYYQAGRTAADFIGASKLQRYAKLTLDFELDRGLDRLISPTVLVHGFSDRWSQVALTLADATVEFLFPTKRHRPADSHCTAELQLPSNIGDFRIAIKHGWADQALQDAFASGAPKGTTRNSKQSGDCGQRLAFFGDGLVQQPQPGG
jgi:hypothetical protein